MFDEENQVYSDPFKISKYDYFITPVKIINFVKCIPL